MNAPRAATVTLRISDPSNVRLISGGAQRRPLHHAVGRCALFEQSEVYPESELGTMRYDVQQCFRTGPSFEPDVLGVIRERSSIWELASSHQSSGGQTITKKNSGSDNAFPNVRSMAQVHLSPWERRAVVNR